MKPICFNSHDVLAILAGQKTTVRRIINQDIADQFDCESDGTPIAYIDQKTGGHHPPTFPCRYQTEDILWVRETYARVSDWTDVDPAVGKPDGYIFKMDWGGPEAPR